MYVYWPDKNETPNATVALHTQLQSKSIILVISDRLQSVIENNF